MKIWQTRIHVGAIFLSKALFFGGAKLGRRIMMVWWVGGEFWATTLDLLFPHQIRINMAFFAFFCMALNSSFGSATDTNSGGTRFPR